jgi:RNA polymerase sigma-70 factor (ECF subfamily)
MYALGFPRVVTALRVQGIPAARAEEAAQEAWVRTFMRWNRVSSGNNPIGYTYRTAIRLARAGWRSRRVDSWMIDAGIDRSVESVVETRVDFDRALRQLPKRQRECIILCAILEYTSEEAAQLLHVNAGTVRAHIHHARKALQEAQQIVPSTTKNS